MTILQTGIRLVFVIIDSVMRKLLIRNQYNGCICFIYFIRKMTTYVQQNTISPLSRSNTQLLCIYIIFILAKWIEDASSINLLQNITNIYAQINHIYNNNVFI